MTVDHHACERLGDIGQLSTDEAARRWADAVDLVRIHLRDLDAGSAAFALLPRELVRLLELAECARLLSEQVLWAVTWIPTWDGEVAQRRRRVVALRLAQRRQARDDRLEALVAGLPDPWVAGALADEDSLRPHRSWIRVVRARWSAAPVGARQLLADWQRASDPQQVWHAVLRDLSFPGVGDSDNTTGNMADLYRAESSPVHRERVTAAAALSKAVRSHRRTLAAALDTAVRQRVAAADALHHESALHHDLAGEGLEPARVETALEQVKGGHVLVHSWQARRADALGLARLGPADLVAPLAPPPEEELSLEDGWHLLRAALSPLGPEYREVIDLAQAEGWVREDRTSVVRVATTRSCPGFSPIIQLAWRGRWQQDLFALAHELGHAVHRYLAAAQPPRYTGVSPVITEFPPLLNEWLLGTYLHAQGGTIGAFAQRHLIGVCLQNYYSGAALLRFQLRLDRRVRVGRPLTFSGVCESYAREFADVYGPSVRVEPHGVGQRWAINSQTVGGTQILKYFLGMRAAVTHAGALDADALLLALRAGSSVAAPDLLSACGVRIDDADQAAAVDARFAALVRAPVTSDPAPVPTGVR